MTCTFSAGYYYELDDSYDESDEEEVRAHLRRVAEQPPLKLDDSTEVRHPPKHKQEPLTWQNHSFLKHYFCAEIGLPGNVQPHHSVPAGGAGAAEKKKAATNAQGAQSLTSCLAVETHSSSPATQHALHP